MPTINGPLPILVNWYCPLASVVVVANTVVPLAAYSFTPTPLIPVSLPLKIPSPLKSYHTWFPNENVFTVQEGKHTSPE